MHHGLVHVLYSMESVRMISGQDYMWVPLSCEDYLIGGIYTQYPDAAISLSYSGCIFFCDTDHSYDEPELWRGCAHQMIYFILFYFF